MQKTMKLVVEVTYDDTITDPDSLSTALDTLMETALSTPGIFEDYGDPEVGEFSPIDETTAAPLSVNEAAAREFNSKVEAHAQVAIELADITSRCNVIFTRALGNSESGAEFGETLRAYREAREVRMVAERVFVESMRTK